MVADRAWLRVVLGAFTRAARIAGHEQQCCAPLAWRLPRGRAHYEPKLRARRWGPSPIRSRNRKTRPTTHRPKPPRPVPTSRQCSWPRWWWKPPPPRWRHRLLEATPPTRIGNGRLWPITVRTGAYEAMVCCSATRCTLAGPRSRPAAGMATAPRWPTRRFRRYTSDAIHQAIPRVRSDGPGGLAGREDCLRQRDLDLAPSLNSRRAASTAGTCAHGACRWRWPAACCWYG